MLARLQDVARARGLPSCVLSFEPHPREFFTPEQAPARLSSLREKAECLQRMGIDRLHVFRFDRAFSALTAEAFIEQVLGTTLQARYVLVGDDFRYGARRAGDFALLESMGRRRSASTPKPCPRSRVAGERASSTAVRRRWPAANWRTPRACWAGPTASRGAWCTATSWGATSAFPPPTSSSSTTGRR
jgi:riboflavin kinase / FMN adenylyltransferase